MNRRQFASLLASVVSLPVLSLGRAIPTFTSGGIVRHRALSMIGDHGPETIIPLYRAAGLTSPVLGSEVIFTETGTVIFGGVIDRSTLSDAVKRYGLV